MLSRKSLALNLGSFLKTFLLKNFEPIVESVKQKFYGIVLKLKRIKTDNLSSKLYGVSIEILRSSIKVSGFRVDT